jgi:hypothetical protein
MQTHRKRLGWIPLALPALLVACGEPKYPAFEVTARDEPTLTYQFSAADATSTSPVVMSAKGRELTLDDRENRVDLQKVWLSRNAPKNLEFLSYGSAECHFAANGGPPFCFVMNFRDPTADREITYYFYGGNWPIPD